MNANEFCRGKSSASVPRGLTRRRLHCCTCREVPHAHSHVQFYILGFIKSFTSLCRDLTREMKISPPKSLRAVRAACARHPCQESPQWLPGVRRLSMVLKHPAAACATRSRGQTAGLPQEKVHFEEGKTTSSMNSRIFTDEEGKYLHNSTAALFFNEEKTAYFSTGRKRLKKSFQFFKRESLLLQGKQESPRLCQMLK